MKSIRTIISLIVLAIGTSPANSQTWQLIWSDEFDGPSIDLTTWNIEVNDLGGYNNELQYYTDRSENVRIENNNLVIEGRKETYLTREYTSARLTTEGNKSWQYGKIEASIKLPYGNGVWPAFWMMGNTGNWPACGEIDIMELVGGNQCGAECGDNHTHGYMWWSDGADKLSGTQAPSLSSGKYADDYHVFTVEWNETSIKWFIDGNQFHSESITETAKSEFHQPFYILLNFAIGGDWPGAPDQNTVFPQKMYVDYVRVYEKSILSAVNNKVEQKNQLHPNPIESTINLKESGFKKGSFKIIDLSGKELLEGEYKEIIDISGLPGGIYVLYLIDDSNSVRLKFNKK